MDDTNENSVVKGKVIYESFKKPKKITEKAEDLAREETVTRGFSLEIS